MTPQEFSKLPNKEKDKHYEELYAIIVGKDHIKDAFWACYTFVKRLSQQVAGTNFDIDSDKDDKAFDRAMKFNAELPDLINTLETLRARMTPEDIKEVEEKESMKYNDKVSLAKSLKSKES